MAFDSPSAQPQEYTTEAAGTIVTHEGGAAAAPVLHAGALQQRLAWL